MFFKNISLLFLSKFFILKSLVEAIKNFKVSVPSVIYSWLVRVLHSLIIIKINGQLSATESL